jgi:hypothetical protein
MQTMDTSRNTVIANAQIVSCLPPFMLRDSRIFTARVFHFVARTWTLLQSTKWSYIAENLCVNQSQSGFVHERMKRSLHYTDSKDPNINSDGHLKDTLRSKNECSLDPAGNRKVCAQINLYVTKRMC